MKIEVYVQGEDFQYTQWCEYVDGKITRVEDLPSDLGMIEDYPRYRVDVSEIETKKHWAQLVEDGVCVLRRIA